MRTMLGSRRVTYWLLTSLCVRYGIAIRSVWLRGCDGNFLQVNDLGFDYPLTSCSFICWTLSRSCVRSLSATVPDPTGRWLPSGCLAPVRDSHLTARVRSLTPSMVEDSAVSTLDAVCYVPKVSNALLRHHACSNWPWNSRLRRVRLRQKVLDELVPQCSTDSSRFALASGRGVARDLPE